jgi:hypothetical protein
MQPATKQGSKIGGFIKPIRNTAPGRIFLPGRSKIFLSKLTDGTVHASETLDNKYEGKALRAASKALDDGCSRLLQKL